MERRRKTENALLRESVRSVLGAEVTDGELREKLKKMGLEEATVLDAIHAALGEKAVLGDVTAAKYLRDALAESGEEARDTAGEDLRGLSDGELRSLLRAWEEEAEPV